MVKSLANELTDILNWVENSGLGEHAREEANAGLMFFCRGLVCGLHSGLQVTGDTPISVDEARARAVKPDWGKAEASRHKERRRESENAQLRPVDEVPCAKEHFSSERAISELDSDL